jgi:hypothetical protein
MVLMQILMILVIRPHFLPHQCGFVSLVRLALLWQTALLILNFAILDQLDGIVGSIHQQKAIPRMELSVTIGTETHVFIATPFLSRIITVTTFMLSLIHPDVISVIVLFDYTLFYSIKWKLTIL